MLTGFFVIKKILNFSQDFFRAKWHNKFTAANCRTKKYQNVPVQAIKAFMKTTSTSFIFSFAILFLALAACNNQNNSAENGYPQSEEDFREGYFKDDPMQRPGLADGNRITDFTLSCEGLGPIRLTDSFDEIKKMVGEDNIKIDSHYVEGMYEGQMTTLWPLTNKEAHIYWQEKEPPFTNISSIEINHPMSAWKFENGIKVGISMDELVKINGDKPITFYGFNWDYGGSISNFNGGAIDAQFPCLSGRFSPTEDAQNASDETAVSGDRPIDTNVPALQHMGVQLSTLILTRK